MPECARLLRILYLGIRKGGAAVGAPVDDAVAAIDQSLIIEVYKYLANGTGAALVHREALARPITGCAELLELVDDARAVLIFPVPNSLKELLSSEIVAREIFVNAQVFLHLDLRCDTCVVRSGHPEGGKALHSLITAENVLERFVQSVSHMELTGYVGRGDNDGEGRLLLIRVGLEIALVAPIFIDAILKFRRGIILRQFLVHTDFLT